MHAAASVASPSDRVRAALAIAGAFACCGVVAWNLLAPEHAFLWRVQQPASWQGALEAVLLWALGVAVLRRDGWPAALRACALLVPCALYLRRHHVDLPFVLAIGYAEGMLLLGGLWIRQRHADMHEDRWLRRLIAGIVLLSLLLWLGQLCGYGQLRAQRLLAAIVLLPLLAWRWRELMSIALLRSLLARDRTPAEQRWGMLLLTLLLVLFARTNAVFDYDSIWYGYRPDRVLAGERSLFEPLGLVAPVYYFPKLYEVLLLPLSASREFSTAQGLTIVCGALLARLCHDLLRKLDVPRALALAGAATAWTIPALANATLNAKPDALTALLVVALVWFGSNVLQGRRSDLYWVFACAALACSAKLLALAYVGCAGIVCLAGAWLQRRDASSAATATDRGVLVAAAAVAGLVAARTWWLTGMPTIGPEQLVAVWNALGMQLQLPVGTLTWTEPQRWEDVPSLLAGWLVDPARFSHLQITWPGNAWVFLPLLALTLPAAAGRTPIMATALLWSVPACGLALLLGVRFMNEGGDGNYFIAPVVLATIGGVALVVRRSNAYCRRALPVALAVFVVFHAAYGFVSAGWGYGTRTFDLDFVRTTRDTPHAVDEFLGTRGLRGVAAYLRTRGGQLRVIGTTPGLEGFHLPARFEGIGELLQAHMGRLRSMDDLLALLDCAGTEALLLPAAGHAGDERTNLGPIAEWLEGLPAERDLYRDADWRLVAADGLLRACERFHDGRR